jgi:hypothetical protein
VAVFSSLQANRLNKKRELRVGNKRRVRIMGLNFG